MFRNPLAAQVLLSSGAIPVYRNPNSSPPSHDKKPTAGSLFDSSSAALARGDVLGVFPEGTSYTEPRIVQVKDGAARAALEYVKYVRATSARVTSDLVIVPVGIVYTDKSQYQSRVVVRYASLPIFSVYLLTLRADTAHPSRSTTSCRRSWRTKRASARWFAPSRHVWKPPSSR